MQEAVFQSYNIFITKFPLCVTTPSWLNHLNHQIRNLCPAAVVHKVKIDVCQKFVIDFRESPPCAGVSGSQLLLPACVFCLSVWQWYQ